MPNFKAATITKKGIELNAKVNFGRGTITFTKAAVGSGEYMAGTDLSDATDLLDKRQELTFVKKEIIDKRTVHLRSIIDNSELEQGYDITEFGIYAEDPDDGEILYSISISDRPDYLPEADIGRVAITIESYVSVSNAENVQIVTPVGAYALADDLLDLTDRVKELEEQTDDGHGYIITRDITIQKDGWDVGAEESLPGSLYLDLTQDDITEDMVPLISIFPADIGIAKNCGMSTTARTINGGLRIYAEKQPQEEIRATLTLLLASSGPAGGGGSGEGYTLPAATKTRLGGVKIGEGVDVRPDGTISVDGTGLLEDVVAADADTSEMLDEVFGKPEESQKQ